MMIPDRRMYSRLPVLSEPAGRDPNSGAASQKLDSDCNRKEEFHGA
jgi:hypothetical protein